MKMESHLHMIAVQQSYEIDGNNGVYIHGKAYRHAKRIEVASALQATHEESRGESPNHSSEASQCQVSRAFVQKIEQEMYQQGPVVLSNMLLSNGKKRDKKESGSGTKTLDVLNTLLITLLYINKSSRDCHLMLPSCITLLEHWSAKCA